MHIYISTLFSLTFFILNTYNLFIYINLERAVEGRRPQSLYIKSWTEVCIHVQPGRYCNAPGRNTKRIVYCLASQKHCSFALQMSGCGSPGNTCCWRSLSWWLHSHWQSISQQNRIKQKSWHAKDETWTTNEHKEGRSDRGSKKHALYIRAVQLKYIIIYSVKLKVVMNNVLVTLLYSHKRWG